MKGAPNRVVINTAKTLCNKDSLDESTLMLYRTLFYEECLNDSEDKQTKKGITFDLMNIGKKESKFRPQYDSCFGIKQRDNFTRTLSFV